MKLFKYTTEEEQLQAIYADAREIRYFHNPSEEVQLAAVKQDGFVIKFIRNPSEAVQLAAVMEEPNAIQFIFNPSEKVIEYILDNYLSDTGTIQLLFAKIGKEGYDKLSDNDKLKIELEG